MSYDVVPESAPFSPEQRAWLNGFLAGVLGSLDAENARSGSTVSLAAAAAMLSPLSGPSNAPTNSTKSAPPIEEDFPWHDSSLSAPQRMSLAEGKPIERQLMAAMAQLDCGSCGYLCKTYAEAIANGTEKNLTLCTPGGSETAKLLRALNKQRCSSPASNDRQSASANPNQNSDAATQSAETAATGTRDNPAKVRFIASEPLNSTGSAKDTRHVIIDLGDSGIKYEVGDALGVYPSNCERLVDDVCRTAKIDAHAKVQLGQQQRTLAEVLRERCLRSVSPEFFERARTRVQQRPKWNGQVEVDARLVKRMEDFMDSDLACEYDVCEFLAEFEPLGLTPQDFADTLPPLRPRLYSIASSQQVHPHQVHLTVGRVENCVRGRSRKGVASTMFSDRIATGDSLRAFVQPHHGFTIPADPSVAMIMVGPGTGIAPFLAFLQQREVERQHHPICGANWLFFGDQTRAHDFLYQPQLSHWLESGLLGRLDLAFSRDGAEKVYVQHRMRECGAELFEWLESGAHFYVCGDAQRMARDVEAALLDIIMTHGKQTHPRAKEYVRSLRTSGRFATDVY